MIKERNEPIVEACLSYADIELILTSLEHYVPRTSHAASLDVQELMAYFKRQERKLFNLKREKTND